MCTVSLFTLDSLSPCFITCIAIIRAVLITTVANNKTTSYLKDKLPNRRPYLFDVNIRNTFREIIKYITSRLPPKSKNTFGIHDPSGNRYLFQFSRVSLSTLRSHKRHHDFIDTPSRHRKYKSFLIFMSFLSNSKTKLSDCRK